MKISWITLLFSIAITHFAVGETVDLNIYKEKYPNASVACLRLEKKLNIAFEKNEPIVTYNTNEELIYLDKHLNGYNKKSVSTSKFLSLNEISAQVKIPKGSDLKSRKIKDFKESGLSTDNVFYDDVKEISFDLGTLVPGAVSNVALEYNLTDLHILPVMYINPQLDYESCEFELNYPKNVDLNFILLFADSLDVKINESTKSKMVKRTYTFNNLKASKSENQSQNWRYYSPQLHVRLKSYTKETETINVIRDLDDLHQWYYTFLDSCAENNTQISTLSDSITKGLNDDYAKAKAIFNWVQKNIRYVAIEDGYMGLIPQKATLVNHNKYGDCKGMSNLLLKLLNAQGLEAYHTWIGTRKLPYTYAEIASPVIDNHMITCLKLNGEAIFLDATDNHIPFGYPSSFIQGKQALVSINANNYEVIEVPIVPANKSKYIDNCTLKIKDNTLYGQCTTIGTGYIYREMVATISVSDESTVKNYIKRALSKGSNKFTLDSVLFCSLDNDTGKIGYKFHVPNYVLSHENEVYVNLSLHKENIPPTLEKTRKSPVEFEFELEEISNYELVLDSNFTADQVPEEFNISSSAINVETTYSKTKSSIKRHCTFSLHSTLLAINDLRNWNETILSIRKNFAKQVIIKSNEK